MHLTDGSASGLQTHAGCDDIVTRMFLTTIGNNKSSHSTPHAQSFPYKEE